MARIDRVKQEKRKEQERTIKRHRKILHSDDESDCADAK